jgi:UDP-3-O-[3-hydroxymyristoyl] glucosamine N-acyltransferase
LHGAKLRNPPGRLVGVDPTARIHPSAKIVEPVRIGAGAVIGPNVVVGPDAVVGDGAHVTQSITKAVVWSSGVIIQ